MKLPPVVLPTVNGNTKSNTGNEQHGDRMYFTRLPVP
jgi:hypothetical protein